MYAKYGSLVYHLVYRNQIQDPVVMKAQFDLPQEYFLIKEGFKELTFKSDALVNEFEISVDESKAQPQIQEISLSFINAANNNSQKFVF